MAIINKSNSPEETPETPKQGIIPGRSFAPEESEDKPQRSSQDASPATENNLSQRKSKTPLVVILFVFVIAAAYGLYNALPSKEKQQKIAFDKEKVELTFDRAVRIYSLIELLNKRIDNSATTLEVAEQRNDDVLTNTLRVTLQQNISDRAEHLQKYADALLELNSLYLTENAIFEKVIKDYIDAAEEQYKVGRIQAAGHLLPILQSIPSEMEAKTHIEKAIGLTP
ncbi:MAG: hypothetical protein ACFHVJ_14190 [Aestuariibacter sp.]